MAMPSSVNELGPCERVGERSTTDEVERFSMMQMETAATSWPVCNMHSVGGLQAELPFGCWIDPVAHYGWKKISKK